MSSADSKFVEIPAAAGAPRITLLSPSPASLAQMFKVWDAELARAREREAKPATAAIARGALDLDALARKKTAVDHAPANGSSIAMLLEHQGRSVLLGSDAHPTVFVPALAALAAHRQSALPLQFDVFKLSHHGSRANVTVDLMQAAQAQHYVVSTNGAIFGHPDDEAMARAIVNGGTQRSLWFNYLTKQTEKWTSEELQSQHQYTARFPDPGGAVVISLAPVVRHR